METNVKLATVGERVRERRKEMGISQTELARRSRLTQPTISSLERPGGSHSSGSLASIASALGVRALWLETGLGEKEIINDGSQECQEATTQVVQMLKCRGSCGNGHSTFASAFSFEPILLCTSLLNRLNIDGEGLVGLYADGDAMASYISHGDIILFDTKHSHLKDGSIFLFDTPDGLRVKRVTRRADGRVVLRCDNMDKTRFPDEEYSGEQAAALTIKGRFAMRLGG